MLTHDKYLAILNGNARYFSSHANATSIRGVLAGSFNPVHAGHTKMAAHAAARLGGKVAFELSLVNVDKPPLSWNETRSRLDGIRSAQPSQPVVITAAPRFEQKIACFSPTVFVVGADTILRVGRVRYYDGDLDKRDLAISRFAESKCRFLVYGRSIEATFATRNTLDLPPSLLALCEFVPESEFRFDISSTQIRSRKGQDSG